MKCWASCLGGCNGKSGEHYFSAGLWGDKIKVEGMPWLKEGEYQILPTQAIVANVLCRYHNSLLSELDVTAIDVWQKMKDLEQMNKIRKQFPKVKNWSPLTKIVDGIRFERWAAKAVIGVFCGLHKDSFWNLSKTQSIQVPEQIVRAVYGFDTFKEPFGLYVNQKLGDIINTQNMTGFQAILTNDYFSGAFLKFRDFKLLVWLDKEPVDFLNDVAYRVNTFRFKINGKYSHRLKFNWQI